VKLPINVPSWNLENPANKEFRSKSISRLNKGLSVEVFNVAAFV